MGWEGERDEAAFHVGVGELDLFVPLLSGLLKSGPPSKDTDLYL